MSLEAMRAQLSEAQKNLSELEQELPNFERLLADNEQAEAEARRKKATLDELVQAKARTGVARELLEQHQSDITQARAEITSLEAQIDRAEKQARLDELTAQHRELMAAWELRAIEAGRSIAATLNDLNDLEVQACLNARARIDATQALGLEPDWTAPSFALTPLLLNKLPEARHMGGGAVTFQPNQTYRVTLEPTAQGRAWRA